MTLTERVELARSRFDARDYRWALPLFSALTEDEALTVVARTYRRMIAESGVKLEPRWTSALDAVADGRLAGVDWMTLSKEAWYPGCGRTAEHTVISHVFWFAGSRVANGDNLVGTIAFSVSGDHRDYGPEGQTLLNYLVEELGTLPTTCTKS